MEQRSRTPSGHPVAPAGLVRAREGPEAARHRPRRRMGDDGILQTGHRETAPPADDMSMALWDGTAEQRQAWSHGKALPAAQMRSTSNSPPGRGLSVIRTLKQHTITCMV